MTASAEDQARWLSVFYRRLRWAPRKGLKLGAARERVKQHGLQRTGTNLIKYLLECHYAVQVDVNIGGWKHGQHKTGNKRPFIFTTKSPFSWLQSIFRYHQQVTGERRRQKHPKKAFARFLRSEYLFEGDHAESPLTHWNTMNRHWLHEADADVVWSHVRFEDLLTMPEAVCARIAAACGIERVEEDFWHPEMNMKRGSETTSETAETFNFAYYLNLEYMSWYSLADLDYVEKKADALLVEQLGYRELMVKERDAVMRKKQIKQSART